MSCSPIASASASASSSVSPVHSSSSSSSSAAHKPSHQSSKQRRSSPLKRQMSLSSSDPSIDPFRSHAAGPFAVLYAAPSLDRDPLLVSPSRHIQPSPRRLFAEAELSGNGNNVGAGGVPSPSRSLLSAFQAISPASGGRTTSLLSGGGAAMGLRSAGIGAGAGLQPASPIHGGGGAGGSPQRRISHARRNSGANSINWASDAMRAANGAASPVRGATAAATATITARSPLPSPRRGVVAASPGLVAADIEEPAWQIYRDPVASTSAIRSEDTSMRSIHHDEPEAEEVETDENAPLNDENSPAESALPSSAVPRLPLPTPRSASAASSSSITQNGRQRRSTLANVLQPRAPEIKEAEQEQQSRERECTPPQVSNRAVDVFGTPVAQTTAETGREEYEPDLDVGSEERRKRRRVSNVE